jgi:hypothetical protein
MAAIGTAWADGAFTEAGWVTEAWSDATLVRLVGATYPQDSMPTDNQRFYDFIAASGITPIGSLVDDYKSALANELGLDAEDYDIQTLYQKYFDAL